MDQSTVISQILTVYRRNQIIFLFLVISEIIFSLFLLSNVWLKRERTINTFQEIFKDLNRQESVFIYYSFIMFNMIISTFICFLSLYSLSNKNIKLFKICSYLYLFSAILTILNLYLDP